MRLAARNVVVVRHTYNLVDLPIVVAGKSGTARVRHPRHRGRLPFHSWFAAFVPKDPYKTPGDPQGFKAAERTDSQLAVLAFAYDSRTRRATPRPRSSSTTSSSTSTSRRTTADRDLLRRGNFYVID